MFSSLRVAWFDRCEKPLAKLPKLMRSRPKIFLQFFVFFLQSSQFRIKTLLVFSLLYRKNTIIQNHRDVTLIQRTRFPLPLRAVITSNESVGISALLDGGPTEVWGREKKNFLHTFIKAFDTMASFISSSASFPMLSLVRRLKSITPIHENLELYCYNPPEFSVERLRRPTCSIFIAIQDKG